MALAQVTIDPIKYLSNLPIFSGKREELYSFVELVDRIFPLLIKYDETSQNIFLDIVKSRLIGKAREVIEINNGKKKWKDIKNLLFHNFGDKLSKEQLFDELKFLTFKTNCVDFYNKINAMLRRLNNKINIEGGTEEEMNNNCKTALRLFMSKIPEPMKGLLYCRQPVDLESAMNILYETDYAFTRINTGRINHDKHDLKYKNIYRNEYKNQNNSSRRYKNNKNHNNDRNYDRNYHGERNYNRNNYNNSNNQFYQRSGIFRNNNYNNNNPFHNQNSYNNYDNRNNTVEPMDVDSSTVNRVTYNVEENNKSENFPLQASEVQSYPI